MTLSEFYTAQFYTWEYRGRGWLYYDYPVHLEPPFIPFFRHGFASHQLDDGKRHTVVSKALEYFNAKKEPILIEQPALDYETVDPFLYEGNGILGIQVKLSKERKITPEKMKACLVMLSSIDTILSFEIIGTEKEIIVQFVCEEVVSDIVTTYIQAYFPSCSVVLSMTFVDNIIQDDSAIIVVDFGLKHECVRSLNTGKNYGLDPLLGMLAILERLGEGEQAGMQILIQPTCNQWSASIHRSVSMYDGSSFFLDVPEAPQLAKEKTQSPLYGVTIRTFSQAPSMEATEILQGKLNYAIITATKSPYNELIPLVHEGYDLLTRIDDIFLRESHRLGMLLNVDELTTLLHLPSESIVSKKLYASSRKTKELPAIAKDKTYVLGENTHHGVTTPVTVSIDDRLRHTHVIGATGTGKSTLLANLILQDIAQKNAVILFDPHGDLVDDIIARIPPERLDDVVLIDPSDSDYPVGINLLQATSDTEKEVLSSDLVSSFRKYATSWGDQMSSVLGNAILAILESTKGGTLHDLRRFLIEKDFRTMFLSTVSERSLLYYWNKEYPLLKTNSIGPIITRLDTFLRPRSIRNMVIQKHGLDFESLCNEKKIILCKLSQGLIGAGNSYLLGSLFLSKIHQAVLRRQQQQSRSPVFIYIDEFQNFITPSMKEMISGIRKYHVGLTLSHQDLQQLQREDTELLNTILGNINTRIVFRVGEPDAKKLQEGFASFDHTDLQNLGKGEAIVRIEQPQYDCSLDTIVMATVPAEQKEAHSAKVVSASREKYARPRVEVETEFYDSLDIDVEPIQKQQKPKQKEQQPQEPQDNKEEPVHAERHQPAPAVHNHATPLAKEEILSDTKNRDVQTHRYLQTLVKRMAEQRGYTATIEMQLPDGSGNVDVLLTKDNRTIAIEICITTDAEWEAHNVKKCIKAKYDIVISLCTNIKQLEKIKQKCADTVPDISNTPVHFFTPDALFAFLDEQIKTTTPTETTMKGYRVNVTYDAISPEEMEQKRKSVTKVVMDSLRRQKK